MEQEKIKQKTTAIKALAKEWLEQRELQDDFHAFHDIRCIKMIDGIAVRALWEIYPKRLTIKIDSALEAEKNLDTKPFQRPEVEETSGEKIYKDGYTITVLTLMIIQATKYIEKLHYHKVLGLSIKHRVETYRLECEVFSLKNIAMVGEMCCVCQETTTQKTPCGHDLCLQCWTQLKTEDKCECCGEDGEYKKCPICREKMHVY